VSARGRAFPQAREDPLVAQILVEWDLDAKQAAEREGEGELAVDVERPDRCAVCDALGALIGHGRYRRWADLVAVMIPRWLCKLCRRTTSALPMCLASHVGHKLATVEKAVAGRLRGLTYRQVVAAVGGERIDQRKVRRWTRRFRQRAAAYLESLPGMGGAGPILDRLARYAGATRPGSVWVAVRRRIFRERGEVWYPFGFHRVPVVTG